MLEFNSGYFSPAMPSYFTGATIIHSKHEKDNCAVEADRLPHLRTLTLNDSRRRTTFIHTAELRRVPRGLQPSIIRENDGTRTHGLFCLHVPFARST